MIQSRAARRHSWLYPSLDDFQLDLMLGALGDPVRLEVIKQLAVSGGVVQGAFNVRVTGQTLSHHLKILAYAGLVRVSQEGRFRRCELRLTDAEKRFPGLLSAVLVNIGGPPSSSESRR